MKHLPIHSPSFHTILLSFTEWLDTQNYSSSAIRSYPIHIRELFHYAETRGINSIHKLGNELLEQFVEHIKSRSNVTREGALSTSHVNQKIQAVSKLVDYLRLTKSIALNPNLQRLEHSQQKRSVLTVEEVKHLFDSIPDFSPKGKRDRAILAVLYGGGLRKKELYHLNLEDVSFENRTIHVKHGKGNKERLVPIAQSMMNIIREYVTGCRDIYADIAHNLSDALFVTISGERIKEFTYYEILDQIVKESGLTKSISPHTFRHSIATHLLNGGMEVEDLAQFLGHSSLDSTMIYTSLQHEL